MKKKYIYGVLAMLGLTVLGTGKNTAGVRHEMTKIISASEAQEPELGYHRITRDGKVYEYNSGITTILYAGVDSEEELVTSNRYSVAPRADSINLIILDDYHKSVKILAVSRDTIGDVSRYTMNGNYRDSYNAQLGYAYSYGDGGKISCENLVTSLSELLGGVPVHEYAITNKTSVTKANEVIGGVEVTVPNDDLKEKYPELTEGSVVKLDSSNVQDFVRYRDINIPFSNEGRMERQEAFVREFLKKFQEEIQEDPETVWKQIGELSSYMQTSITKSQYLNLAGRLAEETFSEDSYYYLEGENARGRNYDEFHLDEDKLQDTILELFYLEEGAE